MKIICLKLFLICTFKDPNLAEDLTNLAENLLRNWTLRSLWSLFFPSLTTSSVTWSDTILFSNNVTSTLMICVTQSVTSSVTSNITSSVSPPALMSLYQPSHKCGALTLGLMYTHPVATQTLPHSTVWHCIVLHCNTLICSKITLLYNAEHCITLHCVCSTIHYTALYNTTLHCTTLHYTVQHYTTLHYTIHSTLSVSNPWPLDCCYFLLHVH